MTTMMNQIPFVFQHWNEEYQWWHPNTVPLDFIVNGEKQLPATHEFMWFDVGTIPDDLGSSNSWFKCKARTDEFLVCMSTINAVKHRDINNNKYIFPVCNRALNYFLKHQNIGFKYVDPKILNDVRNNQALIVFICPYEGASGATRPEDFDILNQWCIEYNLPKNNVYYIHGNLKAPEYVQDYKFTYIPIDGFPGWIRTPTTPIVEFTPTSNNNLFLCYNRRPHDHRILTVSELIHNNLMDRGIVSFGKLSNRRPIDVLQIYRRLDLMQDALKLEELSPIELDLDLEINNPADLVVSTHYEQTFVSVITETLVHDKTIFFSEKIYKSISIGHPFMVVSSPGFLKELKNRGYKTFDKWFDESYDDQMNLNDRISIIIKELNRLSTLSVDELIRIREEMKPVLEHNQNLFKEIKQTKFYSNPFDQCLYLEIKKIWDKFNA